MSPEWKAKLRELAAKAIRKLLPRIADAIAREVHRHTDPHSTTPWKK